MSADDHKHQQDAGGRNSSGTHSEDQHDAGELTPREYSLDLAAIRERLGKSSGKEYWRSLEELSDNPHFAELLHREFPRQASEWEESVDRRDFLKLAAASLALAGLSGCGAPPSETIVPYVTQPAGLTPGKPQFYATSMQIGADAIGLLVESHDGRPTKIEGNPDHPASLGASNAFAQASILGLYDPDRAQVLTHLGNIESWGAFLETAAAAAAVLKTGAGLRILTGSVTSPTLGAQIRALVAQYPQARWHQWEPAGSDGVREGAKLAFGRVVSTVYRPERAEVILSLDADFLASGPGHLRYAKQFARRRKLSGAQSEMNRLYVLEPTPSVTGASADHRVPMRASDVGLFARALATRLGLGGGAPLPAGSGKLLEAVAADLQKHRGASLVIAGEQQPAEVHALAHAINQALGNSGATLYYTEPAEAQPANHLESIRELCADLHNGRVDTLLILGGNPVYDAPRDFDFAAKLKKVRLAVRLGAYADETAEHCHWHIPEAHYLESWSDLRAFDGTASIVQPLIAPLYQGKTAHDVVGAFSAKPGMSAYDLVRATWIGGHTEKEWRKWLHDGVIEATAFAPLSLSSKWSPASLPPAKPVPAGQIEFIFRPDPCVYDGRFANNGWLQELPKPASKLTWDNAALVSPKTAEKDEYKFASRSAFVGGEHGQTICDVVDIELSGSQVSAAVWVLPGQAEGVVTLPLGYGRAKGGHAGTNKGFNAYMVRGAAGLWSATGGSLRKTGRTYPLACTQAHHNMEGRELVRSASLEEFKKNPGFTRLPEEEKARGLSLYKEFEYPGYAWGMAIDLASCNGCNACVVACVSENNIPVVGKEQVLRGREMHWIRIDRYYEGSLDDPEMLFQPVPCQQCENAPCEQVCPVGATAHSAEGLNDMVYNRCIGTRYCSNNCPYKVRRFNFLRFQDWETPELKLMRNPEVTVRSRGVMEKCTYCVQRINNARIEAEKEGRAIRDGEIVTACEAACPSEAIVFGNANDPKSRVAQLKAQQRNYTILAELNARPRTTYLGAVRNTNAELESPAHAAKETK